MRMKNNIPLSLGLAALVASPLASAQSSVILFGVVDAVVSGSSKSQVFDGLTVTASRREPTHFGYNTSR